MSRLILSAHNMAALENAAFAQGEQIATLMEKAVVGCANWLEKNYGKSQFPVVGLLVGSGHNGGDALGIGRELCKEGRQVRALMASAKEALKPLTRSALDDFEAHGGTVFYCSADTRNNSLQPSIPTEKQLQVCDLWLDGLQGFGLNRALSGTHAQLVAFLNQTKKPVVALDLPSGLHSDFGVIGEEFIRATTTLALGAFKPVHFDENALQAIGNLNLIDLDLEKFREQISVPDWTSLVGSDLPVLFEEMRRTPSAHKYKNGKLLVIGGSTLFPGAGILTCLGAGISGVGMIHAWVPAEARTPLLTAMPEIIFEDHLPALDHFTAIVLGPGWVPGNLDVYRRVVDHVRNSTHCGLVLDAGAFSFLEADLSAGEMLCERIVMTPHLGEFARLFPEPYARMQHSTFDLKINRLEAASWAAQASGAVVLFKGARTCIAEPSQAASCAAIANSSPLLAHAGHGDVLAGLLGGLLAAMHARAAQSHHATQEKQLNPAQKTKKAACLAALLQAQTALWFSAQNPAALTLPPGELVRLLPHLPHQW